MIVSGSRPDSRQRSGALGGHPRGDALDERGHRGDVLGRGAAAAAEQVDQAALGEFPNDRGGLVGRLVVLAERVRQAGIRIAGDEAVGHPRDLGQVGPHFVGAKRAIEPDQQRLRVAYRIPERFGDLTRQGASGRVGDGPGNRDRPAAAALLEERLQGEDRGLRVEGVEDRLDQQQVGAAVDQPVRLLEIGVDELLIRDVARARIVDVGRDRSRPVSGAEGAGDEARLGGICRRHRVARGPGQPRGLVVELVRELLHAVVGERDLLRVEGIGLDEVGSGLEIRPVDGADRIRLGQAEQVVIALEIAVPVGEPLTAVFGLAEAVPLDHRAHRAVEHENARRQSRGENLRGVRAYQRALGQGNPSGHEWTWRPAGRLRPSTLAAAARPQRFRTCCRWIDCLSWQAVASC